MESACTCVLRYIDMVWPKFWLKTPISQFDLSVRNLGADSVKLKYLSMESLKQKPNSTSACILNSYTYQHIAILIKEGNIARVTRTSSSGAGSCSVKTFLEVSLRKAHRTRALNPLVLR